MPTTAEVLRRTGGRTIKSIVYDEGAIAAKVAELGQQITQAYPNGDLLVLGLLKGSFIFLGDLVRKIERPLQVDFLVASSYGAGTTTSGAVRLLYDPETRLEGKHIVLVEDIVDSGNTIASVLSLLDSRQPRSLRVCSLLDKAEMRQAVVPIHYTGFQIPNKFVFGYGLDLDEYYRNLPFIGVVDPKKYTPPK